MHLDQSSTVTSRSLILKFKVFILAPLLIFSILAAPLEAVARMGSDLDKDVEAGLSAMKKGEWQSALRKFESALKKYEKKPEGLAVVAQMLFATESAEITVNGKKDDFADDVDRWRQVMGSEQALLEFCAFTAFIAGEKTKGLEYLERVYGTRGVMWGVSWAELVPKVHDLFTKGLPKDLARIENENFGNYYLAAGGLLMEVDSELGIPTLIRARELLPKDPAPSAQLTSYWVVKGEPEKARTEARASLAIDPKQPKVLIDLSSSEWLLGNTDAAKVAAEKAAALDPDLPGPHGFLALFALESGDEESAVRHAEKSVDLSENHFYYATILAVSYHAVNRTEEARKMLDQAWREEQPELQFFEKWFFRGKSLELLKGLIGKSKE